jgi:hypothetical protein
LRRDAAIGAEKYLQAFDKAVLFSQLDIAPLMYTMAHRLLRRPQIFRLLRVQSVMANPPFPFRIQPTRWPVLPIELISDRGGA